MIAPTASPSNPALANRVLAFCQDATLLAFTFDRDATLGQLAERLGTLATRHGGLSRQVQVRLAAVHKGAWAEPSGATAIIRRWDGLKETPGICYWE
jgi:hypothetical protein